MTRGMSARYAALPSRWLSRAKMPSTLSWRCTPIHSKSRQKFAKSASTGRLAARARSQ
jgi:hypothetical protein